MQLKDFKDENSYLNSVNECIESLSKKLDKEKIAFEKDIAQQKAYFAENYYEISGSNDEIAEINDKIHEKESYIEQLSLINKRLDRQKNSAYFGRIDFNESDENNIYYIGMGHIQDEGSPLVYDWRADMSSLFYDFSIGNAYYDAPMGRIEGEITKKRQYKIENGTLQYFIDNDFNISDEILQEELAKDSSDKLKEIVATIQKEQNLLIRSDDFSNWIVQGVAGSGKTSVALHRVAYILYKYKDYFQSQDILILSPSNLFSTYISEVLPLLGEDNTMQTTFDNIADKYLKKFETREEMLNRVLEETKQEDLNIIAIKSSFEFLYSLNEFITHKLPTLFKPKTLTFGKYTILEKDIRTLFFEKFSHIEIYKRIEGMVEYFSSSFHMKSEELELVKNRLKNIFYSMFESLDAFEIYNMFLKSEELPTIKDVNYEDIAPIFLIKYNLMNLQNEYDAKYMIIDEMQDLTPCHIYLFEKLWECPKIYLGDINQCLEKQLSLDYLDEMQKLLNAKMFNLDKSYRSSKEIAEFTQNMIGLIGVQNYNLNGSKPEFIKTTDTIKEIKKIIASEDKKIAIICKNNNMLEKIKSNLSNLSQNITLTTIANCKGIEYFHVIIPFADKDNYKNNLDRNLLYIASTRATMKLTFIYENEISKFLI